jgi:predicted nucleotidyltransferase
MRVVGLITEYNPFHNGHKYHIEEAKRTTGADYAVAVMSGNFVQRGTPAIIDKYSRAQMALLNGVDLVLELPVCYATASAEFFAHGAVALLNRLGIVDYLCFGSECGDVELMKEIAILLLNTPDIFDETLLVALKEGLTYPAARLKAMKHSLRETMKPSQAEAISAILTEPNNILGIEYLKAIFNISSAITPVTIQRKTAHYHENQLRDQGFWDTDSKAFSPADDLSKTVASVVSSATAVRNALIKPEFTGLSLTKNSVPDNVHELLTSNYRKTYPITEEDFSSIIKYKLLAESQISLTRYADITSDLADRMKNLSGCNLEYTELTQKIKTKNMTLTRINRALIHLLLNIQTDTFKEYNRNGYTPYARVLGIRKESSHLLRTIAANGSIPIITKVSKAEEKLNDLGREMLAEDLFATHIYNQAVFEKYHTSISNEYKHGICIV